MNDKPCTGVNLESRGFDKMLEKHTISNARKVMSNTLSIFHTNCTSRSFFDYFGLNILLLKFIFLICNLKICLLDNLELHLWFATLLLPSQSKHSPLPADSFHVICSLLWAAPLITNQWTLQNTPGFTLIVRGSSHDELFTF